MKSIVLIDARNLLYRNNAVMGNLTRDDGFPTGALYGCLSSMISLAKKLPNASFVWVWDGEGETWRHRFTRENPLVHSSFLANVEHNAKPRRPRKYGYKANRVRVQETVESKYPVDGKARADIQIPVLRLILEGSGFRNYQIDGLEGDDLIAILARYLLKHTDYEVIIHSGDRDFYQLLKDCRVKILTRMQGGKPHFVTPEDVKREYKVSVKNWVKFRAWTGDSSDNIPHLRNVGSSIARKMLEAGLDPSLKYEDLPEDKEKFAPYFQPNGVEATWPFVESNYKLCKLVSRWNDERMSEKMQLEVKRLLKHVRFTRDKSKMTSEAYRRVSFALMQYQLSSILSRRDVLWRIP